MPAALLVNPVAHERSTPRSAGHSIDGGLTHNQLDLRTESDNLDVVHVVREHKQEYVFGANTDAERERLRGIEDLWDPGSKALLLELGLTDGWRCLEIGAGGGSLVQWMSDRGASVTAVDIDTHLIDHLASDTVRVECLDVRGAKFPSDEFDLIHARLLFEHLEDRQAILRRLVASLRPGGWMVVEDYDWTCFGWDPPHPALDATTAALHSFATQASGVDIDYGRRIVADLDRAGLIDVRGEGRTRIIHASRPGFDFFRLSIESLRHRAVEAAVLSEEDSEAASERLGDPQMRVYTPVMMAGIGRRAEPGATARG